MFLWLLFLIPLVIFVTARPGQGVAYRSASPQGSVPAGDAPIEIARKRLARGEITPEQFEEIRRAIGA